MTLRMIQVGCGGFGAAWCRDFLPANMRDGRIKPVAAVDLNPEALNNARQHLGLSESRCYTDIRRAFSENRADFATVVVPPDRHEEVVDVALEHGCHLLSEKPIAHNLKASCRIARKVRQAGVKMAVTMSHRFRQDITCFREAVRDPAPLGGVFVVRRGSWRRYSPWKGIISSRRTPPIGPKCTLRSAAIESAHRFIPISCLVG